MPIHPKWAFYYIAVIVGGSVMAIELLSSKWIGPIYGSTTYVWASVIGITLGALALGYFVGGRLAGKQNDLSLMTYLLGAAGIFSLVLPFLSSLTLGMGLKTGIVLSSILLLGPPLSCLGAVTPMLISKLAANSEEAGAVAGRVYAISTLSGVAMTFLFGFWVLPYWGVKIGSFITAGVLLETAVYFRFIYRWKLEHSAPQ